jgi:hypothetical protein
MTGMSRRLLAAATIASTLTLAACGSSHHASTTTSTEIRLPGLGAISYRCLPDGRLIGRLDASTATATEIATVEGNNGQHLAKATLNAPAELSAPPAHYVTLTWRVVQSTEPHTIVKTVHQRFASGGCRLQSSTTSGTVISHTGNWQSPSPWP